MTEDPKVSQRYRELAREEPPPALDDAILAASRRAVRARPAPLVVPTGRRRWYFPLAAAAVIVLAVAVTVHLEREQPDAEAVMQADSAPVANQTVPPQPPAAPAPQAAPEAAPPQVDARRKQYAPDPPAAPTAEQRAAPLPDLQTAVPPPPASAREAEPQQREAVDGLAQRRDEAARSRAKPVPAPQPQGQRAEIRSMREAEAPAALGAAAGAIYTSPEQWLQGIADLRRQGRHEEADKALAEFRRRYPDYKISEAMLEKVEKQK
jgi:hypothetical protein